MSWRGAMLAGCAGSIRIANRVMSGRTTTRFFLHLMIIVWLGGGREKREVRVMRMKRKGPRYCKDSENKPPLCQRASARMTRRRWAGRGNIPSRPKSPVGRKAVVMSCVSTATSSSSPLQSNFSSHALRTNSHCFLWCQSSYEEKQRCLSFKILTLVFCYKSSGVPCFFVSVLCYFVFFSLGSSYSYKRAAGKPSLSLVSSKPTVNI